VRESGKKVDGFSEAAMNALEAYSWPGNVRELQNVIERAVLLGKQRIIGIEDLPPTIFAAAPRAMEPLGTRTLKQALASPERQLILEALEAHHWNRQAAARALGINRTTLYKKMKRLGLEGPRYTAVRPGAD